MSVSGSDSDVSLAIVEARYLFRVSSVLDQPPNMSVAHSLVTQHALTSHALSLHCLQPLRHGKGHLCGGM